MSVKFVIVVVVIVLVAVFYQRSLTHKKLIEKNVQLGQKFLQDNAQRAGVNTTASGLQYQSLQAGQGSVHPTPDDYVLVHYHGTLIDGTVFDSSVERGTPAEFKLKQVISGWTEGLQLMVSGEKMRFFIPADLAYGKRSAGKIEPSSVLIFDVELLGIGE